MEWDEFRERERMFEPVPRHEMSPEGQTLYRKFEGESQGLYDLVDTRTAELGANLRDTAATITDAIKVTHGDVKKLDGRMDDLEKGQKHLREDVSRLVKTVERIDARLGGTDS